MASQGAVSLDTVMVNIESNAGKATANIDKLSASLGNLKATISGGFNNLNKLATALENVKAAASGIGKAVRSLQNVGKIAEYVKPLQEIQSSKGLKDLSKNLKEFKDNILSINADTLENVGRVSTELAEKLKPLAAEMDKIASGYKAMGMLAKTYNVRLRDIFDANKRLSHSSDTLSNRLKGLKNGFSTLSKGATGLLFVGKKTISVLEKPFKKATSKIKQMGFALLSVRSAFTFVRKAASEYLALDDELQKEFTNTWRAMGAQLAPALERVQYLFHQFVRVIYSVILALTGIDLISRANEKAMKGWGKSAKDTLGNLQKFDDLNVVEFKDSGAGLDDKLIDMEAIDLTPIQKIVDWMKEVKATIDEALDTGKWRAVGEVLADGVNDAMSFLIKNYDLIYSKATGAAKQVAEVLNGLINNLNFGDLAITLGDGFKLIRDTIISFINAIEFDTLGKKLTDFFSNLDASGIMKSFIDIPISLLNAIYDVLTNIDWAVVGSRVSDALLSAIKEINNFFDRINFNKLGLKLRDFILNIEWQEIFNGLLDILKNTLSGFGGILAGLLFGKDFESETKNLWLGIASVIAVLLGGVLITKLTNTIGDWINGKLFSSFGSDKSKGSTGDIKDTTKGIDSLLKSVGKATEIIAVLGGLALVIKTITDLLKTFGETGLTVKDSLALVGGVLGEIAIAFAAMAASTKLLNGDDFINILALLGGLSAVLLSLSVVLNACANLGGDLNAVFNGMNKILGGLTILLGVVVGSALLLGSNPMYLIGVLAVTTALSTILLVMAGTLPIILGAVSDFITSTAPSLQSILETIGNLITNIIYALGDTLPPILREIGKLFKSIFDGAAKVVNTVGTTIVKILNTIGKLVDTVFTSLLRFVNELGPAVERLVTSLLRSITKVVNFLIDSIEYLINTLIVDSINSLLRQVKQSKIAELLGVDGKITYLSDVKIRDFTPALATGTNEIPYEGLYHLHPGEAVVPKKYNPALGNGDNNAEVVEKLDMLINTVEALSITNVVNVGNETLYKKQQKYNKSQSNKYGTIDL